MKYGEPLVFAFKTQREGAKRRGIPWRLAYWEWLQIWQDSGNLADRGSHKGQWVMARYEDQGAYEAGNVVIVRSETNSADANRRNYPKRIVKPQERPTGSLKTQSHSPTADEKSLITDRLTRIAAHAG
jgi:hypothetical protein